MRSHVRWSSRNIRELEGRAHPCHRLRVADRPAAQRPSSCARPWHDLSGDPRAVTVADIQAVVAGGLRAVTVGRQSARRAARSSTCGPRQGRDVTSPGSSPDQFAPAHRRRLLPRPHDRAVRRASRRGRRIREDRLEYNLVQEPDHAHPPAALSVPPARSGHGTAHACSIRCRYASSRFSIAADPGRESGQFRHRPPLIFASPAGQARWLSVLMTSARNGSGGPAL